MRQIELLLAIFAAGTMMVYIYITPAVAPLLIFSMLSLAVFYFIFSIFLLNDLSMEEIFSFSTYRNLSITRLLGSAATGMALSSTITGITFMFFLRENGIWNLMVGLTALIIVVLIGVLRYHNTRELFYTKIFKRALIALIIGLIVFSTSPLRFFALQYRHQPEIEIPQPPPPSLEDIEYREV